MCWCPGVPAVGVSEDDVQQIYPKQWVTTTTSTLGRPLRLPPRAPLLSGSLRGFLAWGATALFCTHRGVSVFLGCAQLIYYEASCIPAVCLYAQCLFITALNQSWVRSI